MLIHNLAHFRKVLFFCFISIVLGILSNMPIITYAQPAEEDLAEDKNAQQRAEQIYLFLSSEIAIQRGEIGPAYQTLLGLARTSKDPRVAQRAMELALSAQSPQFALEAAKLWDDLSSSTDSSSKEVLITLLMINNKWRESVELTIAFLEKQYPDKQDAFLLQLQNIVSKAPNQDEALLAFSTIIDSLKPLTKNPNLLFLYALGQEKSGNYKTMESVLRGLLRNKPDDASVLNALGYSFADRNIRLDEALQLIEKAHQISPDDAYILDSVGWIHFRLGRFDLAIEYLEKSFNKLPEAEVGAHLGEVFWVTGKQEEAKAIWKKAEALNVALGEVKGKCLLYGGGEGASLLKNWGGMASTYAREVEVDTLEGLLRSRPSTERILIKIDVEGHEPAVLSGARGLLMREKAPTWIIEHSFRENQDGGVKPRFLDLFEMFWNAGYQCLTFDRERRIVRRDDVDRWLRTGVRDFGDVNYIFQKA